MPTYEYECVKCGNRFECFQSMKDEPLAMCRVCSSPLKRLIGSGAGIIFKGSGFYATDYKAKKPERKESTCPKAGPKTGNDNSACSSCGKSGDSK
ncbi:MAG: FmdB family zinc ribbon protein [Candidatus Omnitrophota bacterium]|nr:FmdB family zinc ribbon protein [Candidatus Omnitrophota bacterium]